MVTATAHQQLTDVVAGMYHAFVHIFTYYYPVLCQSSHLTCLGHFPTKISYSASLSLSGSSLVLGVVGEGGGLPLMAYAVRLPLEVVPISGVRYMKG